MELLGQRKWGKKEKIHECSEGDMKMVSVTEEDVREREMEAVVTPQKSSWTEKMNEKLTVRNISLLMIHP